MRLLKSVTVSLLFALAVLPVGRAVAHHSFAVYFDDSKIITVRGTVTEFQFRNPHGLIRFTVHDAAGADQLWKSETNSPSILERRRWSKESLKYGDEVIVEGWPARDGSHYLRMRKVTRADGTPVGIPFDQAEQK